ncbi:hypothetical protein TREMEDRAFT_58172 [Tremella mesenterica DSM 1558]|uniref:uncharacterized protein n=1 Tax=Tremella mesenterica (strain ATCC 24925 / CBS 8224 / DSM 1558 / NBRC 9311 / NRRL Y-6157 / RJB 2259-6 / UBC 559-6) TaxID=578456 RepID=UPI0003F4A1DB|nr:uncharacterized protein TREMEDRAFT_58172 [Tremella mesenterica DSM 1558]EIW72026.1 hypothetical protein TREMEDRAFT_58172 [Tremella mesenterica DSM 1558]
MSPVATATTPLSAAEAEILAQRPPTTTTPAGLLLLTPSSMSHPLDRVTVTSQKRKRSRSATLSSGSGTLSSDDSSHRKQERSTSKRVRRKSTENGAQASCIDKSATIRQSFESNLSDDCRNVEQTGYGDGEEDDSEEHQQEEAEAEGYSPQSDRLRAPSVRDGETDRDVEEEGSTKSGKFGFRFGGTLSPLDTPLQLQPLCLSFNNEQSSLRPVINVLPSMTASHLSNVNALHSSPSSTHLNSDKEI